MFKELKSLQRRLLHQFAPQRVELQCRTLQISRRWHRRSAIVSLGIVIGLTERKDSLNAKAGR